MRWVLKVPGHCVILTNEEVDSAPSNAVMCLKMTTPFSGADEDNVSLWLTKDEVRTLSEKLKEFL